MTATEQPRPSPPDDEGYDPWQHAEQLGVPVVTNATMPEGGMVACYSRERDAIFLRPGLRHDVEKCALAHEIVHFEHGDIGFSPRQEERADRIAAGRLIHPSRLVAAATTTSDPGRIALELGVTEHILRSYARHFLDG